MPAAAGPAVAAQDGLRVGRSYPGRHRQAPGARRRSRQRRPRHRAPAGRDRHPAHRDHGFRLRRNRQPRPDDRRHPARCAPAQVEDLSRAPPDDRRSDRCRSPHRLLQPEHLRTRRPRHCSRLRRDPQLCRPAVAQGDPQPAGIRRPDTRHRRRPGDRPVQRRRDEERDLALPHRPPGAAMPCLQPAARSGSRSRRPGRLARQSGLRRRRCR